MRRHDGATGAFQGIVVPGDNGVTAFDTDTGIETRNIELHLQGSGGLAELRLRHP